jgi:predicted RecB family endonuclease
LAGAATVIGTLFKLLISSKDNEMKALRTEKERAVLELQGINKTYRELAIEAVKSAEDMANFMRVKEGKEPLVSVLPVLPETHSAPSLAQIEAAEIQTMRAKMAALKRATGQEPRILKP